MNVSLVTEEDQRPDNDNARRDSQPVERQDVRVIDDRASSAAASSSTASDGTGRRLASFFAFLL